MKLMFCPSCADVIRLVYKPRTCKCGKCSGQYLNSVQAEVSGNPTMLGFSNDSLLTAINKHNVNPLHGDKGIEFTAFIIGNDCKSITRVKD